MSHVKKNKYHIVFNNQREDMFVYGTKMESLQDRIEVIDRSSGMPVVVFAGHIQNCSAILIEEEKNEKA